MSQQHSKQWYVVQTHPRKEVNVATRLEQREIDTYVPEVNAVPGDATSRLTPFFPGYFFVYTDLGKTYHSWRWTPGLKRVVRYGNEPVAINEEIIKLVASQVARNSAGARNVHHRFQAGDLVRVKRGPFSSMVGLVERNLGADERVHVLLQAIERTQRATRLNIEIDNLEKVERGGQDGQAKNRKKRGRRTRGKGRPIRS